MMIPGLKDVITDVDTLSNGYIRRDGFVFTAVTNPVNVYDSILIRHPIDNFTFLLLGGMSTRTIEEHIQLINEHKLDKAFMIVDKLDFIAQCPTLKHLDIHPMTDEPNFDISPIYDMPEIKTFSCQSSYGSQDQHIVKIDYSKIHGLEDLSIIVNKGSLNYDKVTTLKTLSVSDFKGENRDLTDLFSSKSLNNLDITSCKIMSLNGIDKSDELSSLSLQYNRLLCDISDVVKVADTLKSLAIGACGKITDFSCLYQLTNLEYLELMGSNSLPSLDFLKNMKNLKTFIFDMNVLDGDLTPCLNIPYVYCSRGRKHYNLKDKDLPKNLLMHQQ